MIYTIVRILDTPCWALLEQGKTQALMMGSLHRAWRDLVQDVKRNGYTWFVVRYV